MFSINSDLEHDKKKNSCTVSLLLKSKYFPGKTFFAYLENCFKLHTVIGYTLCLYARKSRGVSFPLQLDSYFFYKFWAGVIWNAVQVSPRPYGIL